MSSRSKEVKQFIHHAKQHGWSIRRRTKRNHIILEHPASSVLITLPSTPSDDSWMRAAHRDMVRAMR